MNTLEHLTTLHNALARAAREKDAADAAYKEAEAAFKKSAAETIQKRDAAKRRYEELDKTTREAMVQAYQDTGNKHLLTGLEIKHKTDVRYEDAAVLAVAAEKKPEWLTVALDKKAVEKFARDNAVEVLTPDGEKMLALPAEYSWLPVTFATVPGAEISVKSLLSWLDEQEYEETE